ncbi:hypothetical protein INR49_014229, partial [Caranx melampygus]
MGPVAGAVVGTVCAVGAVASVPLVLGAVGFTSAGIAAGSVAAKMMSATAVANGGGVAAGSTVAVLQSIGAAGVSGVTSAVVTGAGATCIPQFFLVLTLTNENAGPRVIELLPCCFLNRSMGPLGAPAKNRASSISKPHERRVFRALVPELAALRAVT